MMFWQKVWSARSNPKFVEKIAELLTEFCLEAAVLISVLGVLDSAVSLGHTPGVKVLFLSFGMGLLFFLLACVIQADKFGGEADGTVNQVPFDGDDEETEAL